MENHARPTATGPVTLVITTKNRRDDLRRALCSARQQTAKPRLLVIDDGSTDGTSDMVKAEFPEADLHRFDSSQGLIAQRNRGALLAQTPFVLSMDDDATFPSTRTIEQTLAEFDDPRVGAVAIPFVDVLYGPNVQQQAPDDQTIYAGDAFRGTAHALRREVFLALNGYREELVHQGEERDFCVRSLGAGFITRLGRADPIHHHESPRRSTARMDFYGRRNDVLFAWHNVPTRALAPHLLGTLANGVRFGLRVRRPFIMLRGLASGLGACLIQRKKRQPLSPSIYRLHRLLRARSAIPLREIEELLQKAGAVGGKQ